MTVRINPSILSADFANLQHELGRITNADLVHVDIMDSHFVPNLTFGASMVERLHQVTRLPLDVHLMIDNPERWANDYVDAGAFSVTFHVEASRDPVTLARRIRSAGARAGLALKPGTAIEPYLDVMHEFDQLLIMTVEPGFGGQKFIESTMPKVQRSADIVRTKGLDIWLQVDGGITEDTIEIAAAAGADTFVAGSSVFAGDTEPSVCIDTLRKAALAHNH